jgi:uncharacterized protein YoxC
VPGQILSGEVTPTDVSKLDKVEPKPNDVVIADTTKSANVGLRPAAQDIINLIGREVPSTSLPGALSKLTAGVGMLGGLEQTLKTKIGTAISNGIGEVNSALNVFGNANLTDMASNLRMLQSGLTTNLNSGLQQAATALAAAATVSPVNAVSRANSAINNITKTVDTVSVQGSGIGEGASVYIDRISTEAMGTISAVTGKITNTVESVAALGSNASKLISNVGNKVDSLTAGTTADPQALASKFGLNMSQLTGLSSNLSTKVLSELENLSKKIPETVDLAAATAKGLALNVIPTKNIPNIPPTIPDTVAPKPEVDQVFLTDLAKTQGIQAVANAYGVSNISSLSSEMVNTDALKEIASNVSKSISNPLGAITGQFPSIDTAQLKDKLSTAAQQLSGVSNNFKSVEAKIGAINSAVSDVTRTATDLSKSVTAKFGSISSGNSPLDKLML